MNINYGPLLALCDFAGMDEEQIKRKIEDDFGIERLDELIEIVVAYMSVGDFGCDSGAFIVFRKDGVLYEVNAGHCSCHGFESQNYTGSGGTQWEPEVVCTLNEIISRQDWALASGGYDTDKAANAKAIREHLTKHWHELSVRH